MRGPMIAVNTESSPPPWNNFTYAPLAIIAPVNKRIGAEVFNVAHINAQDAHRVERPMGKHGATLTIWLDHAGQQTN